MESSSGLSFLQHMPLPTGPCPWGALTLRGWEGTQAYPGRAGGHSDSWSWGQGSQRLGPQEASVGGAGSGVQDKLCQGLGLRREPVFLQERLVLDSSWMGSGHGEQAGMALAAGPAASGGAGRRTNPLSLGLGPAQSLLSQ